MVQLKHPGIHVTVEEFTFVTPSWVQLFGTQQRVPINVCHLVPHEEIAGSVDITNPLSLTQIVNWGSTFKGNMEGSHS